jgi:hypothetical protein
MRKSRLSRTPKNGFVKRLRRSVPSVSLAELGIGIGGAAAGVAFPPAGVLLIPAGAFVTASGLRDMKRELGAKDLHIHFPQGGIIHVKKKGQVGEVEKA